MLKFDPCYSPLDWLLVKEYVADRAAPGTRKTRAPWLRRDLIPVKEG